MEVNLFYMWAKLFHLWDFLYYQCFFLLLPWQLWATVLQRYVYPTLKKCFLRKLELGEVQTGQIFDRYLGEVKGVFDKVAKFCWNTIGWLYSSLDYPGMNSILVLLGFEKQTIFLHNFPGWNWDYSWKEESSTMNREITVFKLRKI